MFSVAIENNVLRTYFTEKVLDCFATGTIPIYLGAPDIGDHFNIDGILTLDDFDSISTDLYYSKMDAIQDKLDAGGNIMRRASYIPKDYIGAFVGHLPVSMTHHTEDRYLTYRECMTIMGLPQDFELLNPARNLNHVCQNVPVGTATDMALEIKAVLEGRRNMLNSSLIYQFNPQKTYEIREPESLSSLESFL